MNFLDRIMNLVEQIDIISLCQLGMKSLLLQSFGNFALGLLEDYWLGDHCFSPFL
jgi:hypothetical protein